MKTAEEYRREMESYFGVAKEDEGSSSGPIASVPDSAKAPESKRLTEPEKAWIACAIDSEGWLVLNGRTSIIGCVNTNKRFIELFSELTGARITVRLPRLNRSIKTVKTSFTATLTQKKKIDSLLKEIHPYLIIKKEKALSIIEWIRIHPYDIHDRPHGMDGRFLSSIKGETNL